MHFMSMLSRLRGCAMRGRQGAAGIRMASRTAAANAFMRHKDLNAAAHGQPEPPPTASFEQQPWPCLSAAPGADDRAAPQLEEHVPCSPCRSASPSSSAQPPLIYLPRGARLRKYREMRAGRGCSSGTSSHAGAPVTMAAIGNSTTPDRLRTWPRASDNANTLNFTLKFHKK